MGLRASEHLMYPLFPFDYLLIGILLAIVVAYFFRAEVPDQSINVDNTDPKKNVLV